MESDQAAQRLDGGSLLPLLWSTLLIVGLVVVDTGIALRALYWYGHGSFYVGPGFSKRSFIGKLAYHTDCLSDWMEGRFTRVLVQRGLPIRSKLNHDDFSRYHSLISMAARNHQLDPNLIKAVIAVESKFNAAAVSPAGASGLMQLMPATAAYLGVKNVFDPEQNINGGSKYLRHLMKRYKGDMHFALAAYNAGPKAVAVHGGIPPYPETRRYVSKVVATYEALRQTNA